jgi:hypothetical protein
VHEVEVEVVPDGRHLQYAERRLHTTHTRHTTHDTRRTTHDARPRAMSAAQKAEWWKEECTVAILRGVFGGVRRSSWERLEMGDSEVAGVVAHPTASPAGGRGMTNMHAHAFGRSCLPSGLYWKRRRRQLLVGLVSPSSSLRSTSS